MSPRRTETRQRAVAVALELFSDKGYDQTSLREVAERLAITKAALYYHFPSKEALLAAVVESQQLKPIEDLLGWVREQPDPSAVSVRQELLARIAEALQGSARPWIRFAERNRSALQEHPDVTERLRHGLSALIRAVVPSDSDPLDQVRSLLALLAIYLRTLVRLPELAGTLGIQIAPDQFAEAALQVAMELVGPR